MKKLSAEQEKEIFECYKKGIEKRIIMRMHNISHNQFQQIVSTGIRREDNLKNKKEKMSAFTTEQEKDIFECYVKGIQKTLIRQWYGITDHQLMLIVRTAIKKKNDEKNK